MNEQNVFFSGNKIPENEWLKGFVNIMYHNCECLGILAEEEEVGTKWHIHIVLRDQ